MVASRKVFRLSAVAVWPTTSASSARCGATTFFHRLLHLAVWRDGVVHRDQFVADDGDFSTADLHVEPTDERSVTARLNDCRAVHHQRLIHPVVRVAAQQHVDARDFRRALRCAR